MDMQNNTIDEKNFWSSGRTCTIPELRGCAQRYVLLFIFFTCCIAHKCIYFIHKAGNIDVKHILADVEYVPPHVFPLYDNFSN